MDFFADITLIAGALGAAIYCLVLSRRLKNFNDLEKGIGGAVAHLASQVEDMTKTLSAAQKMAGESTVSLTELTDRAEGVAQRLELFVASMHDLPVDQISSSSSKEEPLKFTKTRNERENGDDDTEISAFRSARQQKTEIAA